MEVAQFTDRSRRGVITDDAERLASAHPLRSGPLGEALRGLPTCHAGLRSAQRLAGTQVAVATGEVPLSARLKTQLCGRSA